MYLILKGKKPKPICRACKQLHTAKACPRRQQKDPVHQAAVEFYSWYKANEREAQIREA